MEEGVQDMVVVVGVHIEEPDVRLVPCNASHNVMHNLCAPGVEPLERASQEERNDANFSFVAPSSEE